MKDLFRPKQILNQFDVLEFEDLQTFINVYQKDLFKVKNTKININIHSKKEYYDACKIFKNIDKGFFSLIIPYNILEDLLKEGLVDADYNIFTKKFEKSLNDFFGEENTWITKNPLRIQWRMNYDNYKTIVSEILDYYNNKQLRFHDIYINYESFEEMKLKELHLLRFHLQNLMNWKKTTKSDQYKSEEALEIKMGGWIKKVRIDNDLKLYVGDEFLFNLGDHLTDDGESIDFYELSVLRAYLDLHPKCFYIGKEMFAFLNLEQNKRVMGHYNEVPYLNKFLGDNFDL